MKYPALAALGLLFCMALPATAETLLLNAEDDQDLAAWTCNNPNIKVERVPRFATRDEHALGLSPKDPAKDVGPEIELQMKPSVTDWSSHENLVLDLVNEGKTPLKVQIIIDTLRDNARLDVNLPAARWTRVVYPTAQMDPEMADVSRVSGIKLDFKPPQGLTSLYVDNVTLLAPGEKAAAPSAAFLAGLPQRLGSQLTEVENDFASFYAACPTRREKQVADWSAATGLAECKEIRRLLQAEQAGVEEIVSLGERLDRAGRLLRRVPSIVKFAQACVQAGTSKQQDVLVGQATSMIKLLPREMPLELAPAQEVCLEAARNETECFQLAILPLKHDLRQVGVRAMGDLRSEDGHALSSERIDCDVMGYVETKRQPPYGTPLIGWWPDPILDFIGPVDVARGDLQSFWIRVRVPKDQPPGLYRGQIAIDGRGMRKVRIPLTLRVHSFKMPDFSPLPAAVTFGSSGPPFSTMLRDLIASPRWNEGLKYQWADFLADYYITYDSLYQREGFDFEIIDHLNKQGRLGAFNLGLFDVPKAVEGKGADPKALREMLERIGVSYRKAKERGLLDHAYIYGFDEVEEGMFNTVEEAAAAVKQVFPGALILTTTRDRACGMNGRMADIDGWCPTTDHFVEGGAPAAVRAAQARGDQVWWYICIGPKNPYANMFIEYTAIEGRLLMGAMTALCRPDGFLYYQVSLWKAAEPIKTGPFTNWNPQTWRTSHGDGSWTCMGKDGQPVPTIRLENFRDGLEDYAYVRILEEAIRIKEAKGAALSENERHWLVAARAALETPKDLVASLTEFSRDPERLYAWRERLAALIETSQEYSIDPWAGGFSLKNIRNENKIKK